MESELRALVHELQDAWNHGDAFRFAEPFAEDAEFIHLMGGRLSGRAAVQTAHEGLFRTIYARSHVDLRVEAIRPLADDVAAVLARGKLMAFVADRPVETFSRPTFVARRIDGGWRIVLYQNTRIMGEGAPAEETGVVPWPTDPGEGMKTLHGR